MEWDVIFHDNPRYLEIVTRGVADEGASAVMAKAVKETMQAARITRVLIDHRNLSAVMGSIVAVRERPSLFRLIGVLLGVRIAELIRPEHREHFRFLETVCANRGFKVGVHYKREEALDWLLQ